MTDMSKPQLDISPATKEEIPLVYDSWIKGWRTSRWAGCIPNNLFHKVTKDAIHQLLTRGANLYVARAGGRVLGWICYETSSDGRLIVHSAYVKSIYRGYPILEHLLQFAGQIQPGFYTYRTDYLQAAIGHGWVHAPEIARRK
jgi:hypothetical protein